MSDTFDAILGRRPRKIDRPPSTATVARIDDEGTFVALTGDDPRQPHGPCRGGARKVDGGLVPYESPLAVGMNVLVIWTDDGPWIAGIDQVS